MSAPSDSYDVEWVDDATVAALKARLAAARGSDFTYQSPDEWPPDGSRSNAASMRNGSLNGGHRAPSRSPTTSRARPRRNPRASAASVSRRSPTWLSKQRRRASRSRATSVKPDGTVVVVTGKTDI